MVLMALCRTCVLKRAVREGMALALCAHTTATPPLRRERLLTVWRTLVTLARGQVWLSARWVNSRQPQGLQKLAAIVKPANIKMALIPRLVKAAPRVGSALQRPTILMIALQALAIPVPLTALQRV